MNNDRWPDELSALDAELQSLKTAAPPPALRERVLVALQRERTTSARRTSPWWFAACTAAAAVLWINVSISVTHEEGRNWRRPGASPPLVAAEDEIKRIAPELGPHAEGYALSLWSGERLPRYADLSGGNLHFKEIE